MLRVDLKKQFKTNGRVTFALHVNFSVEQGIAVLFGPSGSGKTTILRSIAGIEVPDEGHIELSNQVYFDSAAGINLPMQKRRIGFVFQDYLLFPHLTALENVGYGIKSSNRTERRYRAGQILKLLGIAGVGDRYPRQLSGGEQQRVALARALASDPAVVLLDEPLSALDVSTRLRLLEEIVDVQRKSAIPFVYVTHSPADAVRAGDSALILDSGRIIQEGKPSEVFNAPRSSAVSRAVGSENILVGKIADHSEHEGISIVDCGPCRLVIPFCSLPKNASITIGIRSDDIIVSREPIGQTSARNMLEGSVTNVIHDGPEIDLLTSCGVDLKVRLTGQAYKALGLGLGVKVYLLIKASSCHVLS
ncbi:MAG: ATP-binding cassette domain-containing protein [Terriglobia bacterium]|jgi:molybdate transport system ATP-binding protein